MKARTSKQPPTRFSQPCLTPCLAPYLYRKRIWVKSAIKEGFGGLSQALFGRRFQVVVAVAFWLLATGGTAIARQTVAAQQTGGRNVGEALEVLPSRHLAVQVLLNGQGPFRMILDTGSPLTFVTNAAALKSGLLKPEQAKQPALFGMRGQVTAKTLVIGKTRLRDFSLLVLDHPVIETLQQVEGPIDGILGFSFFSRYRMVIDYVGKTVELTPNAYQPEDMLGSLMARLMNNQPSRRVLAPLGLWGMEVARPQPSTPANKPVATTAGKPIQQSKKPKPVLQEAQPGVEVLRVYANSAAAQGGLKTGDRLLSIEDRWTDTLEDCLDAAGQIPPGETATLRIARQGQTLLLTVTPRAGL